MISLVFRVDGRVAGQGSKNKGRNGVFYEAASKYLKPWRRAVQQAAEEALERTPDFEQDARAFLVEIAFAFPRPQAHHVAGSPARPLKPGVPTYFSGFPDVDKCARAVLDALKKAGVFGDDRLVVQLRATKLYGEDPGAAIVVSPLAEEVA